MPAATTIHTLSIPNWHPAPLNTFANAHWARRVRIKAADSAMVCAYARMQDVPRAVGKRRVSLRITLGPKQRAADPDAYNKSLLDSLVHAGLLTDDNRQGVELAPVVFDRGAERKTVIVLEDLDE